MLVKLTSSYKHKSMVFHKLVKLTASVDYMTLLTQQVCKLRLLWDHISIATRQKLQLQKCYVRLAALVSTYELTSSKTHSMKASPRLSVDRLDIAFICSLNIASTRMLIFQALKPIMKTGWSHSRTENWMFCSDSSAKSRIWSEITFTASRGKWEPL